MDAPAADAELVLQRFGAAPVVAFSAPADRFAAPASRVLRVRNPHDFDVIISVTGGATRGFVVGDGSALSVPALGFADLVMHWAPEPKTASARIQLQLKAIGASGEHAAVKMPFSVTLIGTVAAVRC